MHQFAHNVRAKKLKKTLIDWFLPQIALKKMTLFQKAKGIFLKKREINKKWGEEKEEDSRRGQRQEEKVDDGELSIKEKEKKRRGVKVSRKWVSEKEREMFLLKDRRS